MSYGKVALKAVEGIIEGQLPPPKAWQSAAEEVFVGKKASIEKGCPRGAFLGLCEEGYVQGIQGGNYTRSHLNKTYAIKAADLLKANEGSNEPTELWNEVLTGLGITTKKMHNSQMHVVLALWNEELIV